VCGSAAFLGTHRPPPTTASAFGLE
jgi:hypothetical protein